MLKPQCWYGLYHLPLSYIVSHAIDGFHMPINHVLLEGKRQLYSEPFTLRLLSFSTNGKDSTQHLQACIMHMAVLNTDPDSCPPEVKPCPMKTFSGSGHVQLMSFCQGMNIGYKMLTSAQHMGSISMATSAIY